MSGSNAKASGTGEYRVLAPLRFSVTTNAHLSRLRQPHPQHRGEEQADPAGDNDGEAAGQVPEQAEELRGDQEVGEDVLH